MLYFYSYEIRWDDAFSNGYETTRVESQIDTHEKYQEVKKEIIRYARQTTEKKFSDNQFCLKAFNPL